MAYPEFTTEELAREEWRSVPDFACYEVSNLGRVRSYYANVRKNKHGWRDGFHWVPSGTPKFLRPAEARLTGHSRVTLYDQQRKKKARILVHRLVAMAFIPNLNGLPVVNHLNGRPTDNRASNLEWTTHQGNEDHAAVNGLKASGERNGFATLTNDKVRAIRTLRSQGVKNIELARMCGVHRTTITRVCMGERWQHVD